LKDVGLDGKIILEWLLGVLGWDRIHLGPCEHGNELSGCIKGGEFLDWLSDY